MRYLGRLLDSLGFTGAAARFPWGIAACVPAAGTARGAAQRRRGSRGRGVAICRAATVVFLGACLMACLLPAQRASALDVFADLLYWRATEPVDWVLNTNRLPTNQFIA
ncbi:MAG: hypothetical protein U1E05_05340, partial [Patescibacteria group bacterium]|nr:hypothetical protein [Patescibacteria group bacterium]